MCNVRGPATLGSASERSHVLVTLLLLYGLASFLLLLYGINAYVMIYYGLSSRKQNLWEPHSEKPRDVEWPRVTVQLPIYNERNVAERVIRAAASMVYPRDRLEIQVLDDSEDETRGIVDRLAQALIREGVDVQVVRREDRSGYKAGALANGTDRARGEFMAVFDADFVPGPDFLQRTIPPLLADPKIAFVQTRWGHLNRSENVLTICLSLGIDGHFHVEQPARARSGMFMNFNGTAGVWRRQAIEEAGGWSSRTLTEDLDLSYRVQLAGWKPCYVEDAAVPSELPATITGAKSQQFRWAKGSIQTAMRNLPSVWAGPYRLFEKIEAFLHLTNYLIHPLMLILAALALPLLLTDSLDLPKHFFAVAALPILAATLGPSTMYTVAAFRGPQRTVSFLWWLPFLVIYGVGIAVSNTVAVLEAVLGKSSEFVRTPKKGGARRSGYRLRGSRVWIFEVLMGIYSIGSILAALEKGNYGILPFLAIFAAGFLTVGIRTGLSQTGDA
jgi:cellulose synthase/poly-beta-1,6-N-acetylglucosamine synthase-like glycosyltransferase